jgi:inosine-uridine nucleoside N-ribohydrolase
MCAKERKVPKAVLIDCDPGVDDALALALAMASPELDVQAVTTVHGNVPGGWSYRNAKRMVSFFHSRLKKPGGCPPVFRGEALPLRRKKINRALSLAIHGPDGLGHLFQRRKPVVTFRGRPESSSQLILNLARKLGKKLTIIAVGPLTNLAVATKQDRRVMKGVGEIVIMGGTAQMPGNSTPAAEFNIHCDPEAAEGVLGCGAPITLVGLDVTRKVLLPSRALQGGGPFRGALRELAKPTISFAKRLRKLDGVTLHDPLAVAVAIDPTFVKCEKRLVSVDCGDGPARGMTVVDLRAESPDSQSGTPLVRVALEVHEKRVLQFFLKRMEAYRGWF